MTGDDDTAVQQPATAAAPYVASPAWSDEQSAPVLLPANGFAENKIPAMPAHVPARAHYPWSLAMLIAAGILVMAGGLSLDAAMVFPTPTTTTSLKPAPVTVTVTAAPPTPATTRAPVTTTRAATTPPAATTPAATRVDPDTQFLNDLASEGYPAANPAAAIAIGHYVCTLGDQIGASNPEVPTRLESAYGFSSMEAIVYMVDGHGTYCPQQR